MKQEERQALSQNNGQAAMEGIRGLAGAAAADGRDRSPREPDMVRTAGDLLRLWD